MTAAGRVYHDEPRLASLPVDSRPLDYGIPEQEQDHDMGRIDPRDGQDVVNLLSNRGPVTGDMGKS